MPLPWSEIDTLFLDAGNTLVSMDFAWLADEIGALGLPCEVAALQRAEAAARPGFSARQSGTEGGDARRDYLEAVLRQLPGAPEEVDGLIAGLVAPLAEARRELRLWCAVLPGVPEALRAFAESGRRLVVVSNSDGTVAEQLERAGLGTHFEAVIDSHRVGFEKPDPRIFREALTRCGAEPARTLHVGDLFHVDVTGARAAGLHALLLDPYDDWDGVDCERAKDLAGLAQSVLDVQGERELW